MCEGALPHTLALITVATGPLGLVIGLVGAAWKTHRRVLFTVGFSLMAVAIIASLGITTLCR